MSNSAGEKTEQATPRRLEEALKKGQFACSPEVQTFFVIMAGLLALKFTGGELWNRLVTSQASMVTPSELPAVARRLVPNTRKPALCKALAVARPMPEDAPVTRAMGPETMASLWQNEFPIRATKNPPACSGWWRKRKMSRPGENLK